MSGEAFTSAHVVGSPPDTAIEDWVRFSARMEPLRTPAQLRQLQFHCGKPPPAAEPSTRIFTFHHLVAPGRLPPGFTVQLARWIRRAPFARCAPGKHQRLAIYIVISMPNRKSIASGVS